MRYTFLIFTAAVLSLSAAVPPAFGAGNSEREKPGTIEVTGVGAAQGEPTIAYAEIGVQVRNPDVKQALAEASSRMQGVLSAVEAAGIEKRDIATSQYQVSYLPPEQPGYPQGSAAPPQAGSYEVTTAVTVTVRDLARLGSVLDGAFAAGANLAQGIRFDVADPTELERSARDRAYADARQQAEQLARLAGVKLGPPERITEEGNQPPIGPTFAGRLAAASLAPPVSGGEISVRVVLQVLFRID